MATTECIDCKHQVSELAVACPHCGRPREGTSTVLGRATGQHGATKILSLLLLMIGGIMVVSGTLPALGLWLGISGIVCLVIAIATDKPKG